MTSIRPVIDIVIHIVVYAVIGHHLVSRRKNLNPITEAVRMVMVIEVARTVICHEVPVTRRNPVDIVVLNPEVLGIVHA